MIIKNIKTKTRIFEIVAEIKNGKGGEFEVKLEGREGRGFVYSWDAKSDSESNFIIQAKSNGEFLSIIANVRWGNYFITQDISGFARVDFAGMPQVFHSNMMPSIIYDLSVEQKALIA